MKAFLTGALANRSLFATPALAPSHDRVNQTNDAQSFW